MDNAALRNKRKNAYVMKGLQTRFILNFFILILLGFVILGAILCYATRESITTVVKAQNMSVSPTVTYILPLLAFGGVIVLVLIGVLCIRLALYTSHKIAGPLFRLDRLLQNLASGDFSIGEVQLRVGDEIHDFAHSFNLMTAGVKNAATEIKKKSKELEAAIDKLNGAAESNSLSPERAKELCKELKSAKEELDRRIAYFKT